MKILKNGTIISASKNSLLIHGKSLSGRYGIWVLKRRERTYLNEPTIRWKIYSDKEVIKLAKSI